MIGKIIKGIAGIYYVNVPDKGIYECFAKGVFRYKNLKPLVGDNVKITVLDEHEMTGNIEDILERKNELIRPEVANVDQALVVFAIKCPIPNLNLLDRFLVMMDSKQIKTIICFNKIDLVNDVSFNEIGSIYQNAGYRVHFISTLSGQGIDEIKKELSGKTTVFAGPSGVGKSSMLNAIIPEANSQIGELSEKIERGKNTTRHSEIFFQNDNTYIMDTPGFTKMYIFEEEKEQLRFYFPDFSQYEGKCKFNGCVHINEPDCAVKNAVDEGKLSKKRYDNYVLMYNEIANKKKVYDKNR